MVSGMGYNVSGCWYGIQCVWALVWDIMCLGAGIGYSPWCLVWDTMCLDAGMGYNVSGRWYGI